MSLSDFMNISLSLGFFFFQIKQFWTQSREGLGWSSFRWQPITPAFLEDWEPPHRPSPVAPSRSFSIFSPLVTLSPPLLRSSPSVAPLFCVSVSGSCWRGFVCEHWSPDRPTGARSMNTHTVRAALSLHTTFSTGMPEQWGKKHMHALSCAHTHKHTVQAHTHTHFLTFSALHTSTHIHTYTTLYTQTEWVMQWWKASVLCVNPLTLDSHPESLSPPSVPAKLSL